MKNTGKKENKKICDIVIPVFNRYEHTKQTIESLVKNTDPSLFKLYLIDDYSTDKKVIDLLNFSYRREPTNSELFVNKENIGPGASRNKVCKFITNHKLRSKYLYFSDNDVYFKKDWLRALLYIFEHLSRVKVLGGGCHPYLQNSNIIRFGGMSTVVGIKDAVSGYSQLMTWETWDKYGPFDETMRGQEKKISGSEDWAFCQKIREDGFEVGSIEPEVVIPTGKTNTYGEPAVGHETFKEVEGVMIK